MTVYQVALRYDNHSRINLNAYKQNTENLLGSNNNTRHILQESLTDITQSSKIQKKMAVMQRNDQHFKERRDNWHLLLSLQLRAEQQSKTAGRDPLQDFKGL